MSEHKNEAPKQEQQYSLNDDRRVKVLSPGALVARRFFRNRLAVIGLSILIAMFLFSFLGGVISPYGQDEQFYTYTQMSKEYVGFTRNDAMRFVVADGQEFGSIAQSKALDAFKKGQAEFNYKDVDYTIEVVSDDTYAVYRDGEVMGYASRDLINAVDGGEAVPFAVKLAALKAEALGERVFEADGADYELDDAGNIMQNGAELGYISRIVVSAADPSIAITRDFREKLEEAVDRGDEKFNYTDENGEKNFVIHLLGNQDADGTVRPTNVDGGADADVFIFDTDHGAYSMEASLSYGVWGGSITRNINIYGQPYAPAKSLTIDASNLRTFYTGDTFNPGELVVTATRANGAEESIWGGRLTFTGYDSDTTGTKTVTASFLGATATFEVQVEDLVTEQYTGSYELVQGETPTATDAVLLVDYSHKVCTLTAADGSASITGTLVDAQDNALTMTLNGSDALTVPITEGEDGSKQLTIPAHDEIVSGWGSSTTYSINEAVVTLAAE